MEESSSSSSSDSLLVAAMKLASASALPMALRFALELDLFNLIRNAASASASASELSAQLPAKNRPHAAAMIDRILRLLAANSILTCTAAGDEWRYSLAPLGNLFATNQDGVSLLPFSLLIQDKVFIDTWYHLKDAAMEGGVAFDRAHGMNAFEYPSTDDRFNKVFNEAMRNQSTIFMSKILEKYNGFEGVQSLVDVGGGTGASLKMILAKHPSIKAINFDLPHVIRDAPPLPGVEHIGGDMFVSLPKADAIFMKWICHDWSDSYCEKLLKNCYEALHENGKLIVAEGLLPDEPGNGLCESWAVQTDVLMLAFNPGGKERTEKEFHALASKAGFTQLHKLCCAADTWIMEFPKSHNI